MIKLDSKRRWLKLSSVSAKFVAGVVDGGHLKWITAVRSGGRFTITIVDDIGVDPKRLKVASPSESDAIEAALQKEFVR